MIASTSVCTAMGTVLVRAEDDEIVALVWGRAPRTDSEPASDDKVGGTLLRARNWLGDYFNGRFRRVDFPIRAEGTQFQRRIWEAIADIPLGQTLTYGEIARAVKSAPRAVGGACGANPVAIAIPCHRVLAADGGLGGYSGGAGLSTKRQLLDHEGFLQKAKLVA